MSDPRPHRARSHHAGPAATPAASGHASPRGVSHDARPVRSASAPSRLRLPPPPLGREVMGAAVIGLAGIAVVAVVVPSIGLGLALVPWVSAVMFAGVMATALGVVGGSHPFARFGPANHVTALRVALLAVTAGLAAAPPGGANAWAAAAATLVFAALDGLDGFLARRTRMSSPFGARFDMETDALFILVLSLLVWRHDKAGAWVMTSGVMRYAFAAAGRLLPWMARPLRSTRRGKTVAALQIVALGVAAAPLVPTSASSAVAAAALAALTWSFAVDIRYLWRRRQDAGI